MVHPLNLSGDMSLEGAKRVLRNDADTKDRAYKEACAAVGISFSPGVFDTWGGAQHTMQVLWKGMVKRAVAGLVGTSRATAATAIRRGLSLSVMRGVATQLEALLTTSPPSWSDSDDPVLCGEEVDDAGNAWSHPS